MSLMITAKMLLTSPWATRKHIIFMIIMIMIGFKLTAVVEHAYQISVTNPHGLQYTAIYLYDSNQNYVTYTYTYGEDTTLTLSWLAESSGDYFVLVYNEYGYYGWGTEYVLTFSEIDPEPFFPDDYESDDSSSEATLLTIGEIQTHNFHDRYDGDWYRFSAVPDVAYDIQTFNLGVENDTYIELYNSDLSYIAYDYDSGTNGGSRMNWVPTEAGDYYIYVANAWYQYGYGTEYDISVTEIEAGTDAADAFEPDDTSDDASLVELLEFQRHNFHTTDDEDWVEFVAVADTQYLIETTNLGVNNDTFIELYDSDMNLLMDDADSGSGSASKILWTAPTDGTYYVKVDDSAGSYGVGTQYDIHIYEPFFSYMPIILSDN